MINDLYNNSLIQDFRITANDSKNYNTKKGGSDE